MLSLPLFEVCLVRNLEISPKTSTESQQGMRVPPPPAVVQSFLLIKKVLSLAPGLLPRSAVASLVAVSHGDGQWRDASVRHASSGFTKALSRTSAMRMASELLALSLLHSPVAAESCEVLSHLWDLLLAPSGTIVAEDIPRAVCAALSDPRTRPPRSEV